MLEKLKPPVVIDGIQTLAGATAPALFYNGSGVASLVIQSSADGALMGAVFGANASMPAAHAAGAFPVPYEGIRWKVGPGTRYISVIPLSGGTTGSVVYYFEGQTDVTT